MKPTKALRAGLASIILSVSLLTGLGLSHAESPVNPVLLDQSTFGATSQVMPQNDYGLGANSTSQPIIPQGGRWVYTTKPELKSGANGLPSAYQFGSGQGQAIVVPEAANFRMKMAVSTSNKPWLDFCWRHNGRRYHLDFASGALTKIADGKTRLLAEAKLPLVNSEKPAGPPASPSWSMYEIIVQNGKIQVRVAPDGKTWQDAMECEDSDPIPDGAIVLGEGHFGDIEVNTLPAPIRSRELSAQGPEFDEALLTSMENTNPDDRQNALEYLRHLKTPVPGEVLTALAVAQSDKVISPRLAALRAMKTLNLDLDVQALLLDGLSSDSATVRAGAANSLINLNLAPAQMKAKVVDALMKGDQFARFDVKRLISAMGEPLQADVVKEIQDRYSKATDPRVKVALLRALSLDFLPGRPFQDNPRPEALPVLAQGLSDSSADVRSAAMRTVRFLESPFFLSLNFAQSIFGKTPKSRIKLAKPAPPAPKPGPVGPQLPETMDHRSEANDDAAMLIKSLDDKDAAVGSSAAEELSSTSKIIMALQSILQTDPSAEQRAEAVGCLAELRQTPEAVIAALGDKDASVRSAAAQGLCCFERSQIEEAIPALQKLAADAACKIDAKATLGYIQEEEAKAVSARHNALPPLSELGAAELLEESSRRVETSAKVSLALQAERIPFPGDIMAHYSAQLCLNRNREGANARLRQALQPYAFAEAYPGLGGTKVPLVYALHYSKSRFYPGTFTPETEELFKKSMFSMVDWQSKVYFDRHVKSVERLCGTENQTLQISIGVWSMALMLLNEDPAYASRRLRGGKTVAEYAAEWTAFMKQWMRMRALNGFWIELGSGYCGSYSTPAVMSIYAGATDPELKQLTKMFLDLSFIDDAQACMGDMRGGSKNRKTGIIGNATTGLTSFLYDGALVEGKGCHELATSGYRTPAAALWLYKREQHPQHPIVIANRRLGEVRYKSDKAESDGLNPAANASAPSEDDAIVDPQPTRLTYVSDSKAVNYMYKTRNYMLGSMLRDPKTVMGVHYCQLPWNGLLFADGKGLFPASPWTNLYFSFQHQNVFIFQRDIPDQGNSPIAISYSRGLRSVEENGWIFFIHGDAYAGVKFLTGSYSRGKEKFGDYDMLVADVQTTPVLVHAGDKDEFGSFDAFKAAVQANTLTFRDNKVEYFGPKQPRIEYFLESTGQPPKVDGKPWSPDPVFVYSGPYMQRKEGESVVTVTVAGKKTIYDFDKATVTEVISNQ